MVERERLRWLRHAESASNALVGIAVAQPEEENNLASAFAERLATSKERELADAGAV